MTIQQDLFSNQVSTCRNTSAAEQTETDLADFVHVLSVGELGLQMARVGTTAELVQMAEDNDEESGVLTVRAKAIGRQRFWLRETRQQIDGCAHCFEHQHFCSSALVPAAATAARSSCFVR